MSLLQQTPINEGLYLPSSQEEWNARVQALITELRRPDLTPVSGVLYAQTDTGSQCACIGGVVTDMAVRGGLTASWIPTDWPGKSGNPNPGNAWEISRTQEYGGPDRHEPLNAPLPEACLHHGLSLEENLHHTDIFDMNPTFRRYINREHRTALGYEDMVRLNDRHVGAETNPLRLFADILEHMLGNGHTAFWHQLINDWHRHTPGPS